MWTDVDPNDLELVSNSVDVMRAMDREYKKLDIDKVQAFIVIKGGHVFLYQRDDIRIVFALLPNRKLGRYRVYTCGFAGQISAKDASDIGVAKLVDFMITNHLNQVYAIRRRGLDFGPINEFYDWILKHPDLKVTVQSEMNDRSAWRIELAHAPIPT